MKGFFRFGRRKSDRPLVLQLSLKITLLVLFSWFVVHEVAIYIDGSKDELFNADIAVVFGTTVHENGELSERLAARLNKSIILYKNGVVSSIFVSGGLGKEGYWEGDIMAQFLLQNGIPKQSIIIDNQGNTTGSTAINFTNFFPEKDTKIIVVSQDFHLSRCKLCFKKLGYKSVGSSKANYRESRDIYSFIREFPAYYKYLLFF